MKIFDRPRIEICGGIASGKTSLALALAEAGYTVQMENFKSNPFYEPFYADPIAHAFEAEITFLLQHFHALKVARQFEGASVFDFSIALDYAYSRVTLGSEDQKVFDSVFCAVLGKIRAPDLMIRLRCSNAVQMVRIKQRARPQEQSIELDYLLAIEQALDGALCTPAFLGVRKIEIDSEEIDFVVDSAGKSVVQRLVSDAATEWGAPISRYFDSEET